MRKKRPSAQFGDDYYPEAVRDITVDDDARNIVSLVDARGRPVLIESGRRPAGFRKNEFWRHHETR